MEHKQIHNGDNTRTYRTPLVLLALLALAWAILCVMPTWGGAQAGKPAATQTEQQAALIVQFGDGSYITRCISFGEGNISGLDLLIRSGLQVANWGGAVCRIEKDGCDYPTKPCFCQCQGPNCRYWSYWHWRDGRWAYAQVGSADYRLHDGDVEGWVWGNGQIPPSAVPFSEICVPAERARTSTTPVAGPVPTAPLENTSQKPARPVDPGAQPMQYAVFAIMAVALVAGFWFLRGRHRE